jgi:ABC-type branched-subunit amino acid transport system ATPase component
LPILEVKGLTKKFGDLIAVNNVSFELEDGTITGLIGPNGSGKTTLINLLTKFLNPDHGEIYFEGESITNLKTYQIIQKGIGRTFQIVRLFKNLTVFENITLPIIYINEKQKRETAYKLLEMFGLRRLEREYAKNLSVGQQRLLELAMVLTKNPKLVLLDEPCAGINPAMQKEICNHIIELRENYRTSFLIIEHNVPFIANICKKVIVLDQGKKIAEGTPAEIQEEECVLVAYLGRVRK